MVVALRPYDEQGDRASHDVTPSSRSGARRPATIDRLNRSDPRLGLETASTWLAREQARRLGRGRRAGAAGTVPCPAFLRRYDEAIAQYEEVEARFDALGLPAEAARTQIGHVTALRYKGRYQEAVDLALAAIASSWRSATTCSGRQAGPEPRHGLPADGPAAGRRAARTRSALDGPAAARRSASEAAERRAESRQRPGGSRASTTQALRHLRGGRADPPPARAPGATSRRPW